MNLITPVELPSGLPAITHAQQLLLLGSCFAQNMGAQLSDHAFRADVNPFGVLYNPLSIAAALRQIEEGRIYTEADLFFYRGGFHSSMHHSSFSAPVAADVLEQINGRLQKTHQRLENTDWLLLTWGSAYLYRQRADGSVVGNCHKRPEQEFTRSLLTVDEIVTEYCSLLPLLQQHTPHLKLLLTISPIRHMRDGLHANQLSKATLLLAVNRLQHLFPDVVCYFPAYEIVLDELRDYRFYSDDMLHPSPLAVHYLWERFGSTFFTPETRTIIEAHEAIRKGLIHKPFNPDSEMYEGFLVQLAQKIEQLNHAYPYLDLDKERKAVAERIKNRSIDEK